MDAKDFQIVRALQSSGRLSNQELAERVNLSPSPCLRRLRLLEARGVITGYTALVDAKAYGLHVMAYLQISLERHEREAVQQFETKIRDCDEVLECHLLTGEADYLLRVLVKDLDAYEAFVRRRLHSIPGISKISTSLVYGAIKQTQIFPVYT
jgi:Lrp/AsnC family transcriptional regulator, leucine-responsive regulatory protein